MYVFGVKDNLVDIANQDVFAKFRSGRPYRPDASGGVPDAAKLVIDTNIDGKESCSVVSRDDRACRLAIVDVHATPVTKVKVTIVRIWQPDNAVDTHLVFAASTRVDAAEVERPRKNPAIVGAPVVANLNLPFSVEGASDQFVEVGGRNIVVRFAFVTAWRSGRKGAIVSCRTGFHIRSRYGDETVVGHYNVNARCAEIVLSDRVGGVAGLVCH